MSNPNDKTSVCDKPIPVFFDGTEVRPALATKDSNVTGKDVYICHGCDRYVHHHAAEAQAKENATKVALDEERLFNLSSQRHPEKKQLQRYQDDLTTMKGRLASGKDSVSKFMERQVAAVLRQVMAGKVSHAIIGLVGQHLEPVDVEACYALQLIVQGDGDGYTAFRNYQLAMKDKSVMALVNQHQGAAFSSGLFFLPPGAAGTEQHCDLVAEYNEMVGRGGITAGEPRVGMDQFWFGTTGREQPRADLPPSGGEPYAPVQNVNGQDVVDLAQAASAYQSMASEQAKIQQQMNQQQQQMSVMQADVNGQLNMLAKVQTANRQYKNWGGGRNDSGPSYGQQYQRNQPHYHHQHQHQHHHQSHHLHQHQQQRNGAGGQAYGPAQMQQPVGGYVPPAGGVDTEVAFQQNNNAQLQQIMQDQQQQIVMLQQAQSALLEAGGQRTAPHVTKGQPPAEEVASQGVTTGQAAQQPGKTL